MSGLGKMLPGATGPAVAADIPESDRPTAVPTHNWTGATIAGQIPRDMGYSARRPISAESSPPAGGAPWRA